MLIGVAHQQMRTDRRYVTESTQPSRLYVLLAAMLVLAGVLGYQAYQSAQSHRETAKKALLQYAELAAWRYGELAHLVLSKSFGSLIHKLGKPYKVPVEELWEPSVLLQSIRAPDCCLDVGKPLYSFRIDLSDGAISTAGKAPSEESLRGLRDAVMSDAMSKFDKDNDYYRLVFWGTDVDPLAAMYSIKENVKGKKFVYGFVVDVDRFAKMLALAPPVQPLLPPTLTGGARNDEYLAISVSTRGSAGVGVLGGKLPHTYSVKSRLAEPFADLEVVASIKPEKAEALVIGGLPASRLPVVLGVFALTAALILVAMRQLRRENELARERANFAMGVSHELRTPLTQIRMFLESVLLGRTTSSAQDREYLEIAHEESKRLSNLVDNVLRFSRFERGATRVIRRHLDLAAEVRRIAQSHLPRSGDLAVAVQYELQDGITVNADPDGLRAILGNLLDNAVKYGPKGQVITVGSEVWASRARLWVADEGPGIPREARDSIWGPYRRLDRDLESAVAGTGIGLAIVREYARLHDGDAWVEETSGGGAVFFVEMPLVEGERAVQREATETIVSA